MEGNQQPPAAKSSTCSNSWLEPVAIDDSTSKSQIQIQKKMSNPRKEMHRPKSPLAAIFGPSLLLHIAAISFKYPNTKCQKYQISKNEKPFASSQKPTCSNSWPEPVAIDAISYLCTSHLYFLTVFFNCISLMYFSISKILHLQQQLARACCY